MKFILLFLDGENITAMFNPYYRDLQSLSLVWLQLMNMSVYQILSKSLGNGDSLRLHNHRYRQNSLAVRDVVFVTPPHIGDVYCIF